MLRSVSWKTSVSEYPPAASGESSNSEVGVVVRVSWVSLIDAMLVYGLMVMIGSVLSGSFVLRETAAFKRWS